jgi:hypothetical protein
VDAPDLGGSDCTRADEPLFTVAFDSSFCLPLSAVEGVALDRGFDAGLRAALPPLKPLGGIGGFDGFAPDFGAAFSEDGFFFGLAFPFFTELLPITKSKGTGVGLNPPNAGRGPVEEAPVDFWVAGEAAPSEPLRGELDPTEGNDLEDDDGDGALI